MQKLLQRITQGSLVKQIMVGLVAGILVALVSPAAAAAVGLLGTLFVGALKAVAPVLVLILVMASIANHKQGRRPTFARSCSSTCWAPLPPRWWRSSSALSSLLRWR